MIKFELFVERDQFLGRKQWEDFVNGVDGTSVQMFYGRNGGVDYCVIYENEAKRYEPHFLYAVNSLTYDELKGLCFDLGIDIDGSEEVEDLKQKVLEVDNEDYFEWCYENKNYGDLDYDFMINGYNQGEFCKVLFVSKTPTHEKEELENIFYNTPIVAELKIYKVEVSEFEQDNKEYLIGCVDLCDFLEDNYDYDKQQMIDNFAGGYTEDFKEQILVYLEKNLPDYI